MEEKRNLLTVFGRVSGRQSDEQSKAIAPAMATMLPLHMRVIVTIALVVTLLFPIVSVADVPNEMNPWVGRLLTSIDQPHVQGVFVVGRRVRELGWYGTPQLEITGGFIDTIDGSQGLVGIGPVWQWHNTMQSAVLETEFSFAPTLLSSGHLGSHNMGGVFHFTSGISITWSPNSNRRVSVGLRLQHISNGGTHDHNPGLDSIGLEIHWQPERF